MGKGLFLLKQAFHFTVFKRHGEGTQEQRPLCLQGSQFFAVIVMDENLLNDDQATFVNTFYWLRSHGPVGAVPGVIAGCVVAVMN